MPEVIPAKKPCKRCLLSQMPEEGELQKLIAERIALLPEDEKAEEAVRKERLSLCQTCDKLINGTCGLCGCYVELRAAKKRMACPNVPQKW